MRSFSWLALALAACRVSAPDDSAAGPPDGDCAEVTYWTDADVDGFTDEDDAVDASTWYADVDADGYGGLAAASVACQAPAGSVADATDCDDARADVHPLATELCDGADDDCDGAVDEDPA